MGRETEKSSTMYVIFPQTPQQSSTTYNFLKIVENQNICDKQTVNIKTNTIQ
jgi:hypothetical protein